MTDLDDLLIKTSRTFALSIPLLPEPTAREVTIAYLLFRIADTFEDASHWPRADRKIALEELIRLLESPDWERACRATRGWLDLGPSPHEGYVELISEVPDVLRAFSQLAKEARDEILRLIVRTSRGMIEYVSRTTRDGSLQLGDTADLRHYCYIVAGIVGELLTELFLLGRSSLAPIAAVLRERAALFGEALQLVNILKDSTQDANEGRSYLPKGVDRGEIFELARGDLKASAEYVHALQAGGAPRGIVAFAALPVLLARATLDRVEEAGPGAKLRRSEVVAIVQEMNLGLEADRPAIPGQ